jgi:1-acyl-sn-glycerol-3-phosphate acyltransferase
MGRWISRFILRLMGWRTNGALPEGIKKAVVISAPHTSYWDFVIGRLTFWAIRVNIRFLIKQEAFVFPVGYLLEKMGGVPVERGKFRSNMVEQVVKMFQESESLMVVITPEGTRRKVDQWKKGFYMIAVEAGVPIALSFIDYGNKTGGIGPVIMPSGDFEQDLAFIQDFYRDKTARHPDRFNLSKKQ